MKTEFKKVHTFKDLIISSLVLLAGVGLFFISKGGGIAVMLCGAVLFMVYKSGYKREGDNTLLKKSELELCGHDKAALLSFLEGKSNEVELHYGHEGGTLLLTVWHNDLLPIAWAQLMEYHEQTFQPITEIIKLNDNQTQKIIAKL